jgi:hypothetical protein
MCRFEITCRSISAVSTPHPAVRRLRQSTSRSGGGGIAYLRARYDYQSKKA